jgi:hypothetical protein
MRETVGKEGEEGSDEGRGKETGRREVGEREGISKIRR